MQPYGRGVAVSTDGSARGRRARQRRARLNSVDFHSQELCHAYETSLLRVLLTGDAVTAMHMHGVLCRSAVLPSRAADTPLRAARPALRCEPQGCAPCATT